MQKTPERRERRFEDDLFRYLNSIRAFARCWKNEEYPSPVMKGQSHNRIMGSDVYGIIKPSGRWLAIEVKRESDYKFIMKHYDRMRTYVGPNKKYQRFARQINFIEMIKAHGGLAFFACGWQEAKDRLIQEGIDPGGMDYAGDKK